MHSLIGQFPCLTIQSIITRRLELVQHLGWNNILQSYWLFYLKFLKILPRNGISHKTNTLPLFLLSWPSCLFLSVVFSSWKKTLYIVAKLLSSNGIKYSMIEGSLSLSRRLQELQRYQDHKETNVLLMTLGTGAVGSVTTSQLSK